MGNINNQCLNNNSNNQEDPIICEIFTDKGQYITSCYAHDTISYIKQCYVESCDPPPFPKNIIFKLLANPSVNCKALALDPLQSPSGQESPWLHQHHHRSDDMFEYSYVSYSNVDVRQRVIVLDDTEQLAKYKKYSLLPLVAATTADKQPQQPAQQPQPQPQQPQPQPQQQPSQAKRLIFQIRIEHISRKHKKRKQNHTKTNLTMERDDKFHRHRSHASMSRSLTTTPHSQYSQYHGNVTPSDAYSVVSVESTLLSPKKVSDVLPPRGFLNIIRKPNTHVRKKRKRYKRRRDTLTAERETVNVALELYEVDEEDEERDSSSYQQLEAGVQEEQEVEDVRRAALMDGDDETDDEEEEEEEEEEKSLIIVWSDRLTLDTLRRSTAVAVPAAGNERETVANKNKTSNERTTIIKRQSKSASALQLDIPIKLLTTTQQPQCASPSTPTLSVRAHRDPPVPPRTSMSCRSSVRIIRRNHGARNPHHPHQNEASVSSLAYGDRSENESMHSYHRSVPHHAYTYTHSCKSVPVQTPSNSPARDCNREHEEEEEQHATQMPEMSDGEFSETQL